MDDFNGVVNQEYSISGQKKMGTIMGNINSSVVEMSRYTVDIQ
jgi:hypothetical protein